jgi:hypothetical protein
MSPELPEDEALGRARGTTEWLFEQGLIHLNRGYSNNRIPPPEVEVVIADRENWMATEHDQVFTFNATPKGERLYFTLPREG